MFGMEAGKSQLRPSTSSDAGEACARLDPIPPLGVRRWAMSQSADGQATPRGTTWLLVMLGSLTIAIVRGETAPSPAWLLGQWLLLAVVSALLLLRFPDSGSARRRDPRGLPPAARPARQLWYAIDRRWWIPGLWLVAVVWPLLDKLLLAATPFGSGGEAGELVALGVIQHALMLGVPLAMTLRQQSLSVAVSVFMVVFSLAIAQQSLAGYLAVGFALFGTWWLMVAYWSRLQRGFVAQSTIPLTGLRLAVLVSLTLVIASLVLLLGPLSPYSQRLAGFMPTSGGSQRFDEGARSGVGDGDMLIAAQDDAYSFGPVDSDLFIESDMSSLYDLATDNYGEPPRGKIRTAPAVGVEQGEVKHTHEKIAEAQQSAREFSAIRRSPKSRQRQKPADRLSDAIFFLIGQTPAWIAIERYSLFDGQLWRQPPSDQLPGRHPYLPPPWLQQRGSKGWVEVARWADDSPRVDRLPQRLAIKLIGLKTPRVPSPPLLQAVHIDKIDRPDFFGWTADGQLEMLHRDQIPQMTVLHLLHRRAALHPLRVSSYRGAPVDQLHAGGMEAVTDRRLLEYLQLPAVELSTLDAWRAKAGLWSRAGDSAADWNHVERLIDHLKRNYRLDWEAVAPEECSDVVSHFLEKGAGPDYLFASTAAVLLRSLGWPTRLVSGFYASPEAYDRSAGQTIVTSDDLHTWLEVWVDGDWVPLEPTPTYAVPSEYRTWAQALYAGAWWLAQSMWNYPIAWVGGLLSAVWVGLKWRWLLDLMLTGLFRLYGVGSSRRQAELAIRLLGWRAWLAGCPRRASQTWRGWLAENAERLEAGGSQRLQPLLEATDRFHYAPRQLVESWLSSQRPAVGQSVMFVYRRLGSRQLSAAGRRSVASRSRAGS
jgi:protein-glutamine gamma-glutamyltransferase